MVIGVVTWLGGKIPQPHFKTLLIHICLWHPGYRETPVSASQPVPNPPGSSMTLSVIASQRPSGRTVCLPTILVFLDSVCGDLVLLRAIESL